MSTPCESAARGAMDVRGGAMVRSVALALTGAVALGIVSLLANLTTLDALANRAHPASVVTQLTVSRLTNGALWAVLGIWAGWLVSQWWIAMLVAIAATELALATHYAVGWAIGFFTWGDVLSNGYWFVAGLVVCGPLGLIGWVARQPDVWGLLARLVPAAGLVAEPLYAGWFLPDAHLRWQDALAGRIAGGIELVAGVVLAVLVVRRWMLRHEGDH